MYAILFMIAGAVIRRADGLDKIPKIVQTVLFSLMVLLALGMNTPDSPLYPPVIFVLMHIGLSIGWGKYFSSITGVYPVQEKEIPGIDHILDYFYTRTELKPLTKGKIFGTIGMGLRWTVCFLPFFSFIAIITDVPQIAALSLLLLLVGPMYYIGGEIAKRRNQPIDEGLTYAEYMSGALLGLLIYLTGIGV